MKILSTMAAVLGAWMCCTLPAVATDLIPYPDPGTYNSQAYTFTATTTGDLVIYFAGSSSYYDNQLGILVNGTAQGGFGLDGQTSSVGDSKDYGTVTAGDVITFVLQVSEPDTQYSQRPGETLDIYSDPSLNAGYDAAGVTDHNHTYLTTYSGGIGDPSSALYSDTGVYLGFEDLGFGYFPGHYGGDPIATDYDYNDENFIITEGLRVTPLPEPSSWALLLIGFLSVGAALRWRKSSALPV